MRRQRKAVLEASHRTLSLASSTLSTTSRREEKGAASYNDTVQAQVALAKSALAERRAIGSYTKDLAVLGYSIGLSPHARFTLPTLDQATKATIGELSEWPKLAEIQHPSLIAARNKWEAMTQKVAVMRSDGRPTIDFTANWFEKWLPKSGPSDDANPPNHRRAMT
jgi:outer membrane protein